MVEPQGQDWGHKVGAKISLPAFRLSLLCPILGQGQSGQSSDHDVLSAIKPNLGREGVEWIDGSPVTRDARPRTATAQHQLRHSMSARAHRMASFLSCSVSALTRRLHQVTRFLLCKSPRVIPTTRGKIDRTSLQVISLPAKKRIPYLGGGGGIRGRVLRAAALRRPCSRSREFLGARQSEKTL